MFLNVLLLFGIFVTHLHNIYNNLGFPDPFSVQYAIIELYLNNPTQINFNPNSSTLKMSRIITNKTQKHQIQPLQKQLTLITTYNTN